MQYNFLTIVFSAQPLLQNPNGNRISVGVWRTGTRKIWLRPKLYKCLWKTNMKP